MVKINRIWIRFLNNFVAKPFFNTLFLILLGSAVIYLVHSIRTNSINSLITSYILIFIVILLFYKIDQWISILLLGVYPLVIGITFWRLTNESQYLSIGITGVLVVITAWYSKNMYEQMRISQNIGKKEYIAEVARSIFSAMQCELILTKQHLESGYYIVGSPFPKSLIENYYPNKYLMGNVTIMKKGTYSPNIALNMTGAKRPASQLLKIPDNALKQALPIIQQLCLDYENRHNALNLSLKTIKEKIKPIWADFKNYCDSIDEFQLKSAFNKKNPNFPKEDNYCLILKYILCKGDPRPVTIDDFTGKGVGSLLSDQDILKKYVIKNRESIYRYLRDGLLKEDLIKFEDTFKELIVIIDELNSEIDKLFLEWKCEYYLTDDEMVICNAGF